MNSTSVTPRSLYESHRSATCGFLYHARWPLSAVGPVEEDYHRIPGRFDTASNIFLLPPKPQSKFDCASRTQDAIDMRPTCRRKKLRYRRRSSRDCVATGNFTLALLQREAVSPRVHTDRMCHTPCVDFLFEQLRETNTSIDALTLTHNKCHDFSSQLRMHVGFAARLTAVCCWRAPPRGLRLSASKYTRDVYIQD